MFSNLMVGVVLGIASGGWVYLKIQRYNGGNSQNSAVGGVAVGLLVCLIATTVLGLIF